VNCVKGALRDRFGRLVVVHWVPRPLQFVGLSVVTPIYVAVVVPRVVLDLLLVCPPLAGRKVDPVTREWSIECDLKECNSVAENTPSTAGVCSLAGT